MKTLVLMMILTLSLGAIASENLASDCTKTLHSDERVNPKVDIDKKPAIETREASASQQ